MTNWTRICFQVSQWDNKQNKHKSEFLFNIFQYSPDHWSVVYYLKDLEATPVEVIAVVFCCFLLMMIVGGACCFLRSINLERVPTDTNRRSQTTHWLMAFLLFVLGCHTMSTDISVFFRSCTQSWIYQVRSVFILSISDTGQTDFFIISWYLLLFSPENHHTKPETINHPHVEEMETLFIETEV